MSGGWSAFANDIGRDPAIAMALAQGPPGTFQVFAAIKFAHSEQGMNGRIPAPYGSAVGLSLIAPALLANVDVQGALAALAAAGKVQVTPDGIEMLDFSGDIDGHRCTRCRRRNPKPEASSRCPKCAGRTADDAASADADATANAVAGADAGAVATSTPPNPTSPNLTSPNPTSPDVPSGGGSVASQGSGEPEGGEGQSLYQFLLGTRIRSKARNRQGLIQDMATNLQVQGMTTDMARRLQAAAENVPGVSDPDGLFAAWLGSEKWRAVWDEQVLGKVNGHVRRLSGKLGVRA